MGRLENKVTLVSGGASSIGHGCASDSDRKVRA